jgi:putative ABC transport system substrate-binding protein
MRRREFIGGIGVSAVLGARGAWGQQQAMPVVGFLDSRSPDALADRLRGFRQGLKDGGFVEGENLISLYRWADSQFDRLPALAEELVRRPVAVIVASGGPVVTFAAKAATTTITSFSPPRTPSVLVLSPASHGPGAI